MTRSGEESATVVFAPDSFKGGLPSQQVAAELITGWRLGRPNDDVRPVPLADGGEGTLDVVALAYDDCVQRTVPAVAGPVSGERVVPYLHMGDGTAIIELAQSGGLPLLDRPAPLTASTFGLGQMLHHVTRTGARRIVVAVGGSAPTDGGAGALKALGARFLDAGGKALPTGGGALQHLSQVDLIGVTPPPPDGVQVLVDVAAPLLGTSGAALVFGPQKGASADDVGTLQCGLAKLATCLGGDPDAVGAGAAGGTGYGLAAGWGAQLVPGGAWVSRLVGLPEADSTADMVVSGEGRFDATSLQGKVVSVVMDLCRDASTAVAVVAGQVEERAVPPGVPVIDLSSLAGSTAASLSDPGRFREKPESGSRTSSRTCVAPRRCAGAETAGGVQAPIPVSCRWVNPGRAGRVGAGPPPPQWARSGRRRVAGRRPS